MNLNRQPPRVIAMTGDAFDARDHDVDFVILDFSREAVEACATGSAVDRLMQLSDTREMALAYQGKVSITFGGYDSDPREVFMIPEIRRYMAELTEQWPFWFHFADTQSDCIALLFKLLCKVSVVKQMGTDIGLEIEGNEALLLRLFDGMNTLHDAHGLDESLNDSVTQGVLKAYTAMYG